MATCRACRTSGWGTSDRTSKGLCLPRRAWSPPIAVPGDGQPNSLCRRPAARQPGSMRPSAARIYRASWPLLPIGDSDADRVARDVGFAVERLDLGLREPERREQRGAKVELAGAIAVAVELGAVPGEWHQRLAGIAQPGEIGRAHV